MKKRFLSFALAFVLITALLPSHAFAAEGFADVEDTTVARNVEVLRLLGIVSGDETGKFRPKGNLTRAEFCKMAIELQGKGDQVVRYRSRTIFPDVRASHWASGYINLASAQVDEKQPGLMHGFPDGTFRPDQDISYGEAVTVLMRMLGYTDEDSGGIWPQGYFDLAAASGVTKGLGSSGEGGLLREQAARLFVNVLGAQGKSGGTLFKLGKETTLLSVDIVKGAMRTADGENPVMAKPMASTLLNGLKGRVVYNDEGKALTFLPSDLPGMGFGGGLVAGSAVGDAAVIVSRLGSTAGFEALTGNSKNYTIYRNGVRASAKDLREYDVAIYAPASNAVLVSDTRIKVYYESCTPSPREPLSITVLGGTKLDVLATAQQSIAAFKPGQQMLLLLTADGKVAGAIDPDTAEARANAFGYVDGSGKTTLFCGGSMLPLTLSGADTKSAIGQIVSVSQNEKGVIFLSRQSSDIRGDLNVADGTLGGIKLASDVLVLDNGVLTNLVAMDVSRIDRSRIIYARRNGSNEVDLIVLGERTTGELMGRATVWSEWVGAEHEAVQPGVNGDFEPRLTLSRPGQADIIGTFSYSVNTGDFITAELNGQNNLINVVALTKLENVSSASWIGTNVVNYGGRTYTVSQNIMMFNLDSQTWFDSLETALAYGGTVNLYAKDGVVYAMDVES